MAQQGYSPTGTAQQPSGAIPVVNSTYSTPAPSLTPGSMAGGAFNYNPGLSQYNANTMQGNNDSNIAAQKALAQHLMSMGITPDQHALTMKLQQQAAGQGPSLAQGQLAGATSQNASMAAGQAASARGLNPAMQARMAAESQAGANQQSAGQSAMLRAGEQQQAQGALGSQLNAEQQQMLQAQQLAGGVLQGVGQQNLGQQQTSNSLFGDTASAQNQQNAINAGIYTAAGHDNTQTSIANAATNANLIGSGLNAAGGVLARMGSSGGSNGGGATTVSDGTSNGANSGNDSSGGTVTDTGNGDTGSSTEALAQGGQVPGHPALSGARNSYSNDTVPAMLSPGEIVLPRSVTQGDDPSGHAADFVAAIMRRQGQR